MELIEMGKCSNHPNRETSYVCSKYTTYMCEDCFKCSDPEIYCKFARLVPSGLWTNGGPARMEMNNPRTSKKLKRSHKTCVT